MIAITINNLSSIWNIYSTTFKCYSSYLIFGDLRGLNISLFGRPPLRENLFKGMGKRGTSPLATPHW